MVSNLSLEIIGLAHITTPKKEVSKEEKTARVKKEKKEVQQGGLF